MSRLLLTLVCLSFPSFAFAEATDTSAPTATSTSTVTATSTATPAVPAPASPTSSPPALTDDLLPPATATSTTTSPSGATPPSPPPAPLAPPTTTTTATSTATQATGDAAKVSDELLKELLAVAPHLGLKTGKMTCQLASAVSALQMNLKTQDWERVALMMGWGCTYRSTVPFGAAVYGGLGLSIHNPNAFQTSVLFSLYDWGAVGPGVQIYKDPTTGKYIFQGLLSMALNLNIGVSVDTLLKMVNAATGKQP